MAGLSIRGLTKAFDQVRALDGVDLEVPDGQLVTLLGPSGCGKTTLLRSVAGITDPTEGGIWLGDRRIDGVPPERRNFGMVFQSYALFPHMSVFKNLAFGLEMRRLPRSEIRKRVAQALHLVDMEAMAGRLPRQLSGGQQQRVALARAIVIEPDVLLFDEPLSNLDAKLRDSLRDQLRALQRRLGVTSIYVTHDQVEAMALADEIVIMFSGEIVERGDPVSLYRRPIFRFTAEFLGRTNVIEARLDGDRCRLPWGDERSVENPGIDDPAGVAIRPEDIAISTANGSDRHGEIVERMFLGAGTNYVVDAGGVRVRVNVAGTQNALIDIGTPVRLSPPKSLHLLRRGRHGSAEALA